MYLVGASVVTGFDVHGFLPELHYNPSAGKPPPTMLHCADTVVGASSPRDVLIGLRGFISQFSIPQIAKNPLHCCNGFLCTWFLPELHCNLSAGKPPPNMLHCADTVVGVSSPREVF
ncbi:hypothetical protein PSMA106859_00010 [Pseudoalteromonas maricaloris]